MREPLGNRPGHDPREGRVSAGGRAPNDEEGEQNQNVYHHLAVDGCVVICTSV